MHSKYGFTERSTYIKYTALNIILFTVQHFLKHIFMLLHHIHGLSIYDTVFLCVDVTVNLHIYIHIYTCACLISYQTSQIWLQKQPFTHVNQTNYQLNGHRKLPQYYREHRLKETNWC